jgi:hypothetical protein
MKAHSWPDLTRTKEALAVYDAGGDERDAMLGRSETNDDVKAWEQAVKEAGDKVRLAFWEDTRDRNSKDTIMRSMHVQDVRRMVEDWSSSGQG